MHQFADYLYTYDKFELFNFSHIVSIIFFVILAIFLPLISKNYLSINIQDKISKILGIIIFINYPIWVILEILAGSFDSTIHLPLHLCRFANLLILFVTFSKNEFIFQLLYFWGLSGMFQGLVSPDILEDFPHFHYFRYFAGHHLFVVAMIYSIVVMKFKPTLIGLRNAYIGINVFLVIAFIYNILFDANYFWIMSKPPAGSLLDYMGPWPWYILTGQLVALAHFCIAYFIYLGIRKINY